MPSILPVRIEQRLGPHQVHARVVIAVDCSNVSPITRLPFHLIPEVVRIDAGGIDQRRDDVVSKIVANRALAVFDQVLENGVRSSAVAPAGGGSETYQLVAVFSSRLPEFTPPLANVIVKDLMTVLSQKCHAVEFRVQAIR